MSGLTRRELLRELMAVGFTAAAAGSVLSGCGNSGQSPSATSSSAATTTGGDNAAGGKIRLGFIPLTDCASVVMAGELGFFKKHGLDVEVTKEPSWPIVRDKLATGELEGAHCLFGMPFSLEAGVTKADGNSLKVAMMINNNGQATTLSNKTFGGKVGYADFKGLKEAIDEVRKTKEPTFAMTYPGGTHDIWMHLTLAAAGVDPKSVRIKPIPPPQMVANMTAGNMDGFNVGEPWGGKAVKDNVGFTFIATQDLWKHHPEKALVVNSRFAETRKADLKKVMMAVLETSKYLDDMKNRAKAADVIGGTQKYIPAPSEVIRARLVGDYHLGSTLGKKQFTDDTMMFYRDGDTNFPRTSHAIWFMTQYTRFGMAKSEPDYDAIAKKVLLQDVYKEVAEEMKISVPDDDMKPFLVKADAATFDPTKPDLALKHYATLMKERSRLA